MRPPLAIIKLGKNRLAPAATAGTVPIRVEPLKKLIVPPTFVRLELSWFKVRSWPATNLPLALSVPWVVVTVRLPWA